LNLHRQINEKTDVQAADHACGINCLNCMIGTGERLLRILAVIIVVVSGLSVFISLLSSLRERRYELALMRVMGASPNRLFLLIILEGLMLAFIGAMFGIVLSHLFMEGFSGYLQEAYRYPFSGRILLREELILIAGALLIGLIAAIIPAVQASNTDISSTLTDS